jgi:hypothetical protein
MKAYYLSTTDPDHGAAIVFADKPSHAKNQIFGTDIWYDGEWTDIWVERATKFDDMENLGPAELALKQWRDGWRWFDMDYPDVDEATDEEFLTWYKSRFPEETEKESNDRP